MKAGVVHNSGLPPCLEIELKRAFLNISRLIYLLGPQICDLTKKFFKSFFREIAYHEAMTFFDTKTRSIQISQYPFLLRLINEINTLLKIVNYLKFLNAKKSQSLIRQGFWRNIMIRSLYKSDKIFVKAIAFENELILTHKLSQLFGPSHSGQ